MIATRILSTLGDLIFPPLCLNCRTWTHTDREHIVRAEGFGIEELDDKLEETGSGAGGR